MTRTRILLAGLAAGVAVVVSLFGGVLSDTTDPASARVSPADQALLGRLLDGIARDDTRGYVAKLERRVALSPADGDTLTLLGFAYQQRARETGDPAYFSRSEGAFRRAAAADADADEGLVATGLASLAVSRHRFRDALPLARRALRLDPENPTAYAALGDALANLGRYRQAFRAFDRMAELAPSVGSYARIAYARELLGRLRAAAEAAQLALYLDVAVPEHRAAVLVQLGSIRFNAGRLREARAAFADARRTVPGYLRAEAGLARVDAAEGKYLRAIDRLRGVVDALPLPEYAIWLGDTQRAAGRVAEARETDELVGAIERLLAANGVRTELQTALFDLDHGRRVEQALERAQAAYANAPSIQSADVLAWALTRNERCAEALVVSTRSLRLGTQDALFFFHRGMVERCLGHGAAARTWFRRALAANPHFSLRWAPVARRYVS
jgi:tetratricopeptide (TPR) repeat protein